MCCAALRTLELKKTKETLAQVQEGDQGNEGDLGRGLLTPDAKELPVPQILFPRSWALVAGFDALRPHETRLHRSVP